MNEITKIYRFLQKEYGPQGWWPLISGGYHKGDYSYPKTDDQRFEICVGAILTQNVGWINVEKALVNLKSIAGFSPSRIIGMSDLKLQEAIRPAGYFRQKAKKLRLFSTYFDSLEGSTPTRDELLGVWGVGPETADSMLLYAYNVPTFVVDAYTKRIFSNLGIIDQNSTYDHVKLLFEENLDRDLRVYQEYHALIVEHAKRFYAKKELYQKCPLFQII